VTLSTATSDRIGALPPIDLADLEAVAALDNRFDRKYLVAPSDLASIVSHLDSKHRVLEIDDRRSFRYESVYFDTSTFDSYLMAARQRPSRFKVRVRSYLDTGGCNCEVKERLRDGSTRKQRWPYRSEDRYRLTTESTHYLADKIPAEWVATSLAPTLTVTYRRSTIVDGASRITLDTDLQAWQADGRLVELDHVVLAETKNPGRGVGFDRLLWARGYRPVTISKYCTLLAALDHRLPANKWNRVLRRHFNWAPEMGKSNQTLHASKADRIVAQHSSC
jgi:hypothetical protein